MAEGIHRMLGSKYWKNTVFPSFERVSPIDASKIESEQKGVKRPLPSGDFARGIVEEIRKHPLVVNPSTDYGLWAKPTVLLHNARGGVEYQEEQVKYFGSAMLDLNSPNPWGNYMVRAKAANLPTPIWRHCHTYAEIESLLLKIRATPEGTGGLNLEDVVSEGLSIPKVAAMIDEILGKQVILSIPVLGWMQNLDWSALSRHVFHLEYFINDPWPDWVGLTDVELAKQLQQHAIDVGAKKVAFLCGLYDASSYNPNAKTVTAAHYLSVLKQAGVRFGGIYLGDNNGADYARWRTVT